jgi:hypothetical protein
MTVLPAGIRVGMTGAPRRKCAGHPYWVAEISVVAWRIMDGLSGARYGHLDQEDVKGEAPVVGGRRRRASLFVAQATGGRGDRATLKRM